MSVVGFDIQYTVPNASGEAVLQRMSLAFERAGAEAAKIGQYMWPKLTPLFEAELARQFDAQGAGPNSGKWAPLTPKYAARKDVLVGTRVTAALAAAHDMRVGRGAGKGASTKKARALKAARGAVESYLSHGTRILELSGALRDSFTNSNSQHALRRSTADTFEFGSNLTYASFHQTGTDRMVARPEFDFTDKLEAGIRVASARAFREAIDRSGLEEAGWTTNIPEAEAPGGV